MNIEYYRTKGIQDGKWRKYRPLNVASHYDCDGKDIVVYHEGQCTKEEELEYIKGYNTGLAMPEEPYPGEYCNDP